MNIKEAEEIFENGKKSFDELSNDTANPGSYGEFVRAKFFIFGWQSSSRMAIAENTLARYIESTSTAPVSMESCLREAREMLLEESKKKDV